MTKLFESAWRDGFEFFERVYDPLLNRSVKHKINLPFEWYEPKDNGLYESILDPALKFDKKQGRSKDGRGHYGFTDPIYRNIRENYWQNNFNKSPRVWYLDIETRSGRSYKNSGIGNITIRNTKTQKCAVLSVKDCQETFYNMGEEHFQYLDGNEYKPLSTNFYMQRNRGFPVPEKALEQVSMIQIFDSELNQVIMIGLREWKHQDQYEHLMEYPVNYIVAKDEYHLFEIYAKLFKELDPLIIYAWNGLGFDYPYLFNRLKNLELDTDILSNYGKVKLREDEFKGQIQFKIETPGHFYIDMVDAYKHYIKSPRSSYTLDNIAEVELKENKVDHSEYVQFDHFYLGLYNIPENPTQQQLDSKIYQLAIKDGVTEEVRELGHSEFCWYSYKDPLLIKKLDDKLNFTALIVRTSERMGVQISDSFGTVRPWSNYIANIALQRSQVLPPNGDHDQPNVVGGYVKDPVRGKHRWVISSDVASMYPLLGMTGFNMSPETILSIDKVPSDLRPIILSYFNDQDEGKLLDYPDEVWEATTELLLEHKLSLSINGAVFRNDKVGIIPELVLGIYNERKSTRKIEGKYKNQKLLIEDILHEKGIGDTQDIQDIQNTKTVLEYTKEELQKLPVEQLKLLLDEAKSGERQYWTEQTGLKLIINSLYGAMAMRYFPLFNEKMAQAITGNGRFFIRLLSKNIENKLQSMLKSDNAYVTYNDTDSIYYQIADFVDMFIAKNPDSTINEQVDFADSFEKKVIAPVIQATIDEMAKKLNIFNVDVIAADREIIADSAVFIQKKKYLARVRDNEGFRYPEYEPEIKVMGLDIIKSSTPVWSKVKLLDSVEHILDKNEQDLRNWLKNTKSEYLSVNPNDLAQVGGVNNLDYVLGEKGVPIGARSALVHNQYVIDNNLEDVYAMIEAGDKTKRMFLRTPNKFNSNIVAYTNDSFIKEFDGLIDYDMMFEKGFTNALDNMTDALGYNLHKETEELDDW